MKAVSSNLTPDDIIAIQTGRETPNPYP